MNITNSQLEPGGKRTIFVTLLLSFLIHVTALLAFQGIFPLPWLNTRLKTYKVDLIRPPIKEIAQCSKEKHAVVSQLHSETPMEPKEATISLDTKDSTYIPYTKLLKERIYHHWIYPASARENFIQGSLLIIFKLDRNGKLVGRRIVQTSKHQILDTCALRAIESADPFPPFPENIKVQFLNINASFAYRLQFDQ